MAIDTEKLLTILNAAQNPVFKKLLEERTKKQEEKAKLDADLAALDEKISTAIPPELLALLSPVSKAADASKPRKVRKAKDEMDAEPDSTPAAAEAAVPVEAEAVATV